MKKLNLKHFLSNYYHHLTATLLVITVILHQTNCQDFQFGYDGLLGPDHWGEKYHTCDGKFQSPINIDMLNVQKEQFPPLLFDGFDKPVITADLANNGHTVQVTMEYAEPPTISGGPLEGVYTFAQFHFHWGDNDTYGSEARINNHTFPVELHIVFYKLQYDKFDNALKFPDGIVVLAFFYELSDEGNEKYEDFTSHLKEIVLAGSHTKLLNIPKLQDLLSNETAEYYTYTGSLTTPPCSEVVTWIDFAVPIPISSDQVTRFRELYSSDGHQLTHNFRPIQPLNGRIIYQNILYTLDRAVTPSDIDQYDISNDISRNDRNDKLDYKNRKPTESSSSNMISYISQLLIPFTTIIAFIKYIFYKVI